MKRYNVTTSQGVVEMLQAQFLMNVLPQEQYTVEWVHENQAIFEIPEIVRIILESS